MRPRQACLGISGQITSWCPRRTCFNEAEASLPRNPAPLDIEIYPVCGRFNEAEASLPRNHSR